LNDESLLAQIEIADCADRALIAAWLACLANCFAMLTEELVGFDQFIAVVAKLISDCFSRRFITRRVVFLLRTKAKS
jgi:hypothetical protein